jgi:hypothetical protein
MTEDNLATRPRYPEIGGHVMDTFGRSFGKVTSVHPGSDEVVIKTNKGVYVTISEASIFYNGGGEYILTDDIELEDPVSPEPVSNLNIQIGGDHYKQCLIQPVEFIEANQLGFLEGCVVKRVTRHNKPTGKGRQDIEKAIHELQLLLELRYSENN